MGYVEDILAVSNRFPRSWFTLSLCFVHLRILEKMVVVRALLLFIHPPTVMIAIIVMSSHITAFAGLSIRKGRRRNEKWKKTSSYSIFTYQSSTRKHKMLNENGIKVFISWIIVIWVENTKHSSRVSFFLSAWKSTYNAIFFHNFYTI